MTVGYGLAGSWRRVGLVVDGVRVTDPCEVLWLQSPEWYADIRLPRDPDTEPDKGPTALFARPWAFAGIASWDPPMMTWDHQFDSRPEPAADAGPLVKVGDLLVEEGWVGYEGRRVPFVEEWRKISTGDHAVSAVRRPEGVQVTVGPRRITVDDLRPLGDFLAVREELGPAGWEEVGRLCVPPRRSPPGGPPPVDRLPGDPGTVYGSETWWCGAGNKPGLR